MPSLDAQPADALLDRIRDLERRLSEVSTVRRQTANGVQLYRNTTQALTGPGFTDIIFDTQPYQSSTAFIGTLPTATVTIPTEGIYAAVATLGRITAGTPAYVQTYIRNAETIGHAEHAASGSTDITYRTSYVGQFAAGAVTGLRVYVPSNTTFQFADFSIFRLSDAFAQ